MHRTNYVPGTVLGGVLLGLLLSGAASVSAQERPRTPPQVIRRTLGLNSTDTLQMIGKDKKFTNIKTAIEERGTVIQVKPIATNPTQVQVTGVGVGISKVTLIDADDTTLIYEITVELDLPYLKSILQRAVPTASVVPVAVSNSSIILTGTVAKAEDIPILENTARAVLRSLTVGSAPAGAGGAGGQPGGPGGGPGGATGGSFAQLDVVNALRVGGVMQVQLDVVVARVSRTEIRRMNFDFLNDGNGHFFASTQGQNILVPSAAQGGGIAGTFPGFPTITNSIGNPNGAPHNIFFALFNTNQDFFGFLQALRDERLAKILAQPRLVTMSGRPATFLSGGEQAIPEAQGLGTISVRFEPFGTRLSFLPIVLGNGKIYLEVEPEVSLIDPAVGTSIGGTVVPGRSTQRVRTSVEMEDGQSYVIGGLINQNVLATTTKLPILGDLPFIGAAFSSKSYTDQEDEMVILVTPHLVDAMDCNQAPKQFPGQETRKPDDFELFLEGILEAPRGPREVFPNKHYVPAYKNGPTANNFPCADPGSKHGGGNCGTTLAPAAVPMMPMPVAPPSGLHLGAAPAPKPAAVEETAAAAPSPPPAAETSAAAPAIEVKPASLPPVLLEPVGTGESK